MCSARRSLPPRPSVTRGGAHAALAALAPHLAPEQRSDVLGEALAAAKAIGDEWRRSHGSGGAGAPSRARSSSARRSLPPRPSVTRRRAPRLWRRWRPISRPEQLGEALAAAKAIGDERAALTRLWRRWRPISRPEQLGEALAAAKAIGDEGRRSRLWRRWRPISRPSRGVMCSARRSLPPRPSVTSGGAPRLWRRWRPISRPEQLGEALAAAKAIGDEWQRSRGSGGAGAPSRARAARRGARCRQGHR